MNNTEPIPLDSINGTHEEITPDTSVQQSYEDLCRSHVVSHQIL